MTLLGPQSRLEDKLLRIWLVCPQNGTAVLKGLKTIAPLCKLNALYGTIERREMAEI